MITRRGLTATALLALAAMTPAPAVAHPHVWVEMRSDVVFNDQGQITAMNLMWTFDDNYALMALEGLDANGDGVYDPTELDPLTRENMASLKDYEYFTVIRFNGEKQALGPATDAGQIYSNGKLQLHMQVPLVTPLDPTRGAFMAKVYDPDFFIAFDYAGDDPVSVLGAMPTPCKLVVKPVPTDAELEQTRAMLATKGPDWKPETEEDFGALFAQPVTIQCTA